MNVRLGLYLLKLDPEIRDEQPEEMFEPEHKTNEWVSP